MRARIARLTEDGFALEFESGMQNRIRMIAQVYSGRYRSGVAEIELRDVAIALAQRLLRQEAVSWLCVRWPFRLTKRSAS
jgi:hypothetical protein